jgi:hypothetical protein
MPYNINDENVSKFRNNTSQQHSVWLLRNLRIYMVIRYSQLYIDIACVPEGIYIWQWAKQSQFLWKKNHRIFNQKRTVYHGKKPLFQEWHLRPCLSEIRRVSAPLFDDEATYFFTRTNNFPKMKPIQVDDLIYRHLPRTRKGIEVRVPRRLINPA